MKNKIKKLIKEVSKEISHLNKDIKRFQKGYGVFTWRDGKIEGISLCIKELEKLLNELP
jgi:hypothetical protein